MHFLAHGLWTSNAGIGESLYNMRQHEASISPLKESLALLGAQRTNIDQEIARLKKMVRRASKHFGDTSTFESDSSSAVSILPPKILNTLKVSILFIYSLINEEKETLYFTINLGKRSQLINDLKIIPPIQCRK